MEDIDAAFHQSISRTPENQETKFTGGDGEPGSSANRTSKISLSGLLNALDGVGAQEGRLLFATTNQYEALDPALRRPGRMDVHVEFKLASQYQAAELFKRFYSPDNVTAKKVEDGSDRGESGEDSGYSTPSGELTDVELTSPHRKELDLAELALLGEKFKISIPEREISMAALQGYLMMYKDRPYDAVESVEAWVQEKEHDAGTVHASAPQDSSGQS